MARLVSPGVPRHVTQRGNNRQSVFRGDDDWDAMVCPFYSLLFNFPAPSR